MARANNVKFGRKPKLTAHQQDRARERLAAGESARAVAKDLGVAHTTMAAHLPGCGSDPDIGSADIAAVAGTALHHAREVD